MDIPGTEDPPIPNPFYYTILAELVRGCEGTEGNVLPSANLVVAKLKSSNHESQAIHDIMTMVNDALTSSAISNQLMTALGEVGYSLSFDGNIVTVDTNNQFFFMFTNSAVVQAGAHAHAFSQQIAAEQRAIASKISNTNTLIQNEALDNAQQGIKAQALVGTSIVFNNRTVSRAQDRNVALIATNQEAILTAARNNIPE